MKKTIAFLCALAVALCACSCSAKDTPPTEEKTTVQETVSVSSETVADTQSPAVSVSVAHEIWRAQQYGFVPENCLEKLDDAISFEECYALFGQLFEKTGTTPSDNWNNIWLEAENPESATSLNRFQGALLLYYAAREVDLTEDYILYHMEFNLGDTFWHGTIFEDPLFPHANEEYLSPTATMPDRMTHDKVQAASLIQRHVSAVNNAMLIDVDKNNSFRWGETLTWETAIIALVRLYESDYQVAKTVDVQDTLTEESAAVLDMAYQRKAEILSSPTEITVEKTAYYVSNSGNDENDGLSPETAWATLDKVNEQPFVPGDVVFFKRGDIWRSCFLRTRSGVTYSAYGEGDKPIFTASPENGTGAEKWELYYEDESGKKIWRFHADLSDCGNICFDDGASYGYKKTAHWRYGKWVDNDNKDIDYVQLLDKDLSYFGDISSELPKTNSIEPITYYNLFTTGPLYLRCDAGNPGEVFSSIEFGSHTPGEGISIIQLYTENVTLDNLCIRHTANAGIMLETGNNTVQNCEIGWCGGNMQLDNYQETWSNGSESVTCGGGGVNVIGQNQNVLNCYIHDTFQESVTIEASGATHKDITVKGNMFERTGDCIIINYEDSSNGHFVSDTEFSDNISLLSGYQWGATQDSVKDVRWASAFDVGSSSTSMKNVVVKDNIFIGCFGYLLSLDFPEDGTPPLELTNNTFYSLTKDAVAYVRGTANGSPVHNLFENAETTLAADIGNDTNRFILLEQKTMPLGN